MSKLHLIIEKIKPLIGYRAAGIVAYCLQKCSRCSNCTVPSIFTANASLNDTLNKPSIPVLLGEPNIFKKNWYSVLEGPEIGATYYTAITYSLQ